MRLTAYERWLWNHLESATSPKSAQVIYNQIAHDLVNGNPQTFDLLEKANPSNSSISPEAITNAVHYLYNNGLQD